MMLKLATVTLVAFFSLSPPYEQDTAALKHEIEALKAQQAEMQRDLDAIAQGLSEIVDEDYLRYRVRANNIGTFVVAPVYGEAMYRPSVYAQGGPAGTLKVVAPESP